MKVIIVGCGRVGAFLARDLDHEGHDVTIVDRNQESFGRLGQEFNGTMIQGTGIDEEVLRRAGIESADMFVAVTNGDNTNAMSAQVAKYIFNVPKVVARLYDPVREETYKTLGLDTVSPTTMAVETIKERLGRDTHG